MNQFIKLTFIFLISFLLNVCASPEERASRKPAQNVCPNLGKLDEKQVNPDSLFFKDDSNVRLIAAQTKNLGVKIYNSLYFFGAMKITEQSKFEIFQRIYAEVCGDKPTFLASIPFAIQEAEKKVKFSTEAEEWKKIFKSKKIEKMFDWKPSSGNTEVIQNQEKERTNFLDQKVMRYCKKSFPKFAKQCEMPIFESGGDTGYKLYDFFRISVLAKNPNTGEKIGKEDQKLISSDLGIEMYFNNDGRDVSIVFKEYNGKLTIKGLKAGGDYNPNGWEFLKNQLIEALSQFPKSDSWDFDYIDKI